MKTKFKIFLPIFLILELFFAYATAYAQSPPPVYGGVQSGIQTYLCSPPAPVAMTGSNYASTGNTPSVPLLGSSPTTQIAATNQTSTILYQCINQIYKFAIVAASVLGVFFIVIAGYVYMNAGGNQESVDKAKNIFTSTLAAIVILMIGYVLLRAINPDLTEFQSIQPTNIVPPSTGGVPTTGTQTTGNGCSGCVDLSTMGVPTKGGASILANPTLANELLSFVQTSGTSSWYVTAAYATSGHTDPCHLSGTCADIGMAGASASQWGSLCTALRGAGFSGFLNEATSDTGAQSTAQCGPYHSYDSTGPNVHVYQY